MKYTAVKLKYYEYILIAVLYGLLLFPYMCSVLNTIPTADDFSFANEMRQWMGITDNYMAALIRFAVSQWLNWGGSWFVMMFPCGFNPLGISDNPFPLLQLEMLISFLFFVSSYMILNNSIFKYLVNIPSRIKRLFLTWISLCVMLNTDIYPEIFYWCTGVNYISMVGFELLAIALMIGYFKEKKNRIFTFLFVLSGIYACNGLQCIVPVILLYLAFIYFNPRQHKKDRIRDYWIGALFLISAVSVVCAPGNFIRHKAIDSTGLHLFTAVKHTIINMIWITVDLLSNPICFLFFLASFAMGLFMVNREIRHRLFTAILLSIVILGMMYPVAVGYSSASMPNRVIFVYNVHILLYLSSLAYLFGNYAAKETLIKGMLCASTNAVIGIAMISYVVLGGWIKQSPYYITLTNIESDKRIYQQFINVLEEIRLSEDANVIVYTSSIPESPILKRLYIGYDPGGWNNVIAKYYGKESVVHGE